MSITCDILNSGELGQVYYLHAHRYVLTIKPPKSEVGSSNARRNIAHHGRVLIDNFQERVLLYESEFEVHGISCVG